MSNFKRALRAGLVSSVLAIVCTVAAAWNTPDLMPLMAVPMVLVFVGIGVGYAPGYDETGPFPRRRREQFAAACVALSVLAWVGVGVWVISEVGWVD